MYSILFLSLTIGLSVGAPFSSFDLKRPTDTSADDKVIPDTTSKLLTIVKKNLKPNKDHSTVLVSEELVIASTGFPAFDAFDQNSDGFIDFDEFVTTEGKDHKTNFKKADSNGDHKLTPEEFSSLSLVVYEPEEDFSDSDGEEPPMVFLTPPESITRFNKKEEKSDSYSDTTFDDYKDIADSDSSAKEETKDDKEVNEDNKETKTEDKRTDNKSSVSTDSDKSDKKSDKKETIDPNETNDKDRDDKEDREGTHFTAEDMPIKIDDEDDEEMIDVKDEDIPMEVIDDLSDDNHYDLDDVRQPDEDDMKMNDQLNSVE